MGQMSQALNLPLVAILDISLRPRVKPRRLSTSCSAGGCGTTATVPSSVPLPPRITKWTLAPVLSQPTMEKPLVLHLNNRPESSAEA